MKAIRLIFAAYLIIFGASTINAKLMEFLINNKYLAEASGMTRGDTAVFVAVFFYFVIQVIIAKLYLKIIGVG